MTSFSPKSFELRRKRPGWYSGARKKTPPRAGEPHFILWSQVPPLGHAAYAHPQITVSARPSFNNQFYPIAGLPSPAFDTSFNSGSFNTLNPATDLLDITDAQLQAKIDAHADWMARYVANVQYANGLFRGLGNVADGLYGGCLHWHEAGNTIWDSAQAFTGITPLLHHPADAVLRSVSVATGPSSSTTIVLPKRLIDGGAPVSGTTTGDLAAIEALTNNVRHTGYFSLYTSNGRAATARFVRAFAARLKWHLDNFVHPVTGQAAPLCYPAWLPLSLEQYGFVLVGGTSRTTVAAPGVEQTGSFWNARFGDARYTNETIYRVGNVNYTLAGALTGDPDVSPQLGRFASGYAPAAGSSTGNIATLAENYAFRRLEIHVMNWATAQAISAEMKAVFPLIEVCNFDHVQVKSIDQPYRRVGGGYESTQTRQWLDADGPTLYGRNTGAGVEAIRTGVANAVEAWDFDNRAEILGVMDRIETKARPVRPFVHGVQRVENVVAGAAGAVEWGGTPELFKHVATRTHEDRGVTVFNVYSGDTDLTTGTIGVLTADLAGVVE